MVRPDVHPVPDACAPPAPLALAVVEGPAGFDALEQEWDALLARSDASVFQSFEWQRTWWRHFGESRPAARLHLITLRDLRGLVAVAPLYLDETPTLGLLPLRRLLFVGHGDSDYLDLLVERGRERECAERVAAQLCAGAARLDALVLEDTSDRSRIAPLLRGALARRGWATSRTPGERCPRTALGGTWEETLAAFRHHTRHEIRRRSRGLAASHRVELEVLTGGPEVEPAMRALVELHQERWACEGYWGVFSDRRRAAFQLDVAGRLARRGWLFLAFLRVDGGRAAASYGFTFGDTLAVYLTGARDDPALARFSPARILHARSMEWAVGAGRAAYDFMRGGERYKRDAFDAVDVPNWTVVAYPRRPALARLRLLLHAVAGKVRRRSWREAYALGEAVRRGGPAALGVHLLRAARRIGAELRRALRPPRPRRTEQPIAARCRSRPR